MFQEKHKGFQTFISFHLIKLFGNPIIRSSDKDVLVVAITMFDFKEVHLNSLNNRANYSVILHCCIYR